MILDPKPAISDKQVRAQIAAIIPLYNGEKFIRKSLESALRQTLAPTEIVVVDDGSTDGGPEIVKAMTAEHQTIRLVSKPNGGQSSARNLGVSLTQAPLIALLDQDDAWYPRHLEKLVQPFIDGEHHNLGWVYSDLDEYDEHWRMITSRLLSTLSAVHPKRSLIRCLSEDMFILPSASLISREAFEAVGGFDERLCGYEDDDLFLAMFRAGYENVFLTEPLSGWRIYAGSTSYSPRMLKSRAIYCAKLVESFPDDAAFARYYRRDAIAPRFFRQWAADYVKGIRIGSAELSQMALSEMCGLARYFGRKRRLKFAPVLFGLRFQRLAQIGMLLGLHRLFARY